MRIQLVGGVMLAGTRHKPGDEVDVSEAVGRALIYSNRAVEIVEPEVVEEPEPVKAPPKKVAKKKAKKKAAKK